MFRKIRFLLVSHRLYRAEVRPGQLRRMEQMLNGLDPRVWGRFVRQELPAYARAIKSLETEIAALREQQAVLGLSRRQRRVLSE